MEDALNVLSCVLKVNVQCCAACPNKVKKKLQKINGVYAIDIDTKNGLVTVRGNVQPSILIQTISEKIGKKAELYGYEKNPKIRNEMLDKGNVCSACKYEEKNQTCCLADESNDHDDKGDDDRDQKDHVPERPEGSLSCQHHSHVTKKKKHGFAGWFGKSCFEPRMFGNFGGPRPGYARLLPPTPVPPLPPPAFPLPSYGYGQYPPVYPYSPPYRITKPPRPYPYDFYENKEPAVGNSAFHSFRDDNVNACSIM